MVNKKNPNLTKYDIIAVISTLGIIGWVVSDFFGGMILILLTLYVILVPIIILYLFSFTELIISLIKKEKKTSIIKLTSHLLVLLTIIIFNLYHSDFFKSKRILTAILKDDLYHYRLVFRENGVVENQANGVFGYSKIYYGKYKFEEDFIIFTKIPYDNDFLPDTVLLDRKQNAIFLTKDENGQFSKNKVWLNHFEIE